MNTILPNASNLSKKLTCLDCSLSLKILCTYTNEFKESTDRIEAIKLVYQRCNKTIWICKSCNNYYAYESIKSLKLHNRRFYNMYPKCNNRNKQNTAELEIENVDSVTNDGYLTNLEKEDALISFVSNL